MEDPIRHRAYELWEAAGKPEGADQHFWFVAAAEMAGEAAKAIKPARKRSKPAVKKAA
ncbi:MAG: hypothetical protein JWR51_193 [Devosia sp.]|jgi:hypothetical protein|uniref:DUF2934 domain-containing protein n=1 Tax=Devosia sp. TaxID=1871048 RepID=UPI002627E466|nr:DUF2934 domain-containing protein [Devosia sp.]MDB5527090.1 hypothetical protein [Devosia sp.]